MNPERLNDRADVPGKLNVLSIFLTVDGEANYYHPGSWSVFVRLTGCRVGCHWCDTKYSWSTKQGNLVTPGELLAKVMMVGHGCTKVTITGGEPLEQDGSALCVFLALLGDHGIDVTMETAGTLPVERVLRANPGLRLVLDYKLPGARALKEPYLPAFNELTSWHVVKFIIDGPEDLQLAIQRMGVWSRSRCPSGLITG